MGIRNGARIVTDFVSALRNLAVKPCHFISKNVFEIKIDDSVNCLIYVKGRGQEPYRWGVTRNVVNRLRKQSQKWFVILLHDSHNTGYLLSSADVSRYIDERIWPLGKDGDYKPASGAYLNNNIHFNTFDEFIKRLFMDSSL